MGIEQVFRGDIKVGEWLEPSESFIKDDLDLSAMAKLALNYLRGNPDPDRGYECKFSLGPLGIPYHLPEIAPPNKYGYDPVSLGDTDCRMDWQYSHMRAMAGELNPDDVEIGVRKRIRSYQGADHLVWINPAAYIGEPIDGTWATTWSSVKLLYSLAEEYNRTGDQEIVDECSRIFESVRSLAIWDGDKAWYPGICPIRDGEWLARGWCESFKSNYPFIVEPCVRYWECTGDEEALAFARAVTEGFLAHSQPDMGNQRIDDNTGAFEGHVHMHTHTIWGVAHLGAILQEQRYLDWARKAHDFVLSMGTDYGWYPEFVPQQEYRTEICVVGDMVSIEGWLAQSICPDYWDIIERTVRNMLEKSQFTLTPAFIDLFRKLHHGQSANEVEEALEALKKIEGGFVAQASFNDWVSYVSDEMGSAGLYRNGIHMMGCCPPEGMRALWEAWNGIVTETDNGVYVNMAISRDHPAAEVVAGRPEDGVLIARSRKDSIFCLRPPAWTDRSKVKLSIDGRDAHIKWGQQNDKYVEVYLGAGDTAELSWPVPKFTQEYSPKSIPDRDKRLKIQWTGNRVDSIKSTGEYLPMFGSYIEHKVP